ncbi:MAG TPA: DUF4287 domain-containing protein [Alphaproteobacteria bacterium]|nr:DUF4287 domain-containing protein [Alphaproteobacteria bacterium]
MALSPQEMETAIIKNLPEKTGKSLEQWVELLAKANLSNKKEQMTLLKKTHGVGHFQAQTIIKASAEE